MSWRSGSTGPASLSSTRSVANRDSGTPKMHSPHQGTDAAASDNDDRRTVGRRNNREPRQRPSQRSARSRRPSANLSCRCPGETCPDAHARRDMGSANRRHTVDTHSQAGDCGLSDYRRERIFCMRIAQHLGLDAARVETTQIAGRKLVVVERYDRSVRADGAVERIHQEKTSAKRWESPPTTSMKRTPDRLCETSPISCSSRRHPIPRRACFKPSR